MNNSPVTTIVPCYKCSDTIIRAVESVVKQTLPPSELILIDDFSQDGTLEILQSIQVQYGDWVRVVALKTNVGAAAARNIGWSLSTQPYIALLDADDAWHSHKIEIQFNFMERNPNVFLCGHNAKILDKNIPPDWNLSKFDYKHISRANLLISNPFATPSVMIRNQIPLRFDPLKRYVDDHLLWLKIAYAGYKIVKIEQALVAIYKPMFGFSGLSSNLWAMEKSELDNYKLLYKEEKINIFIFSLLFIYSLIKYFRRVLISALN